MAKEAQANRTGDVRSSDPKLQVQVLEDPTPAPVKAQGDTVVTNPEAKNAVILVDLPEEAKPATAGELRKMGYDIPADVKANEVPVAYAADRRVGPDDKNAVVLVQLPDNPADDGLTPIERAMLSEPEESGEPKLTAAQQKKADAEAKAQADAEAKAAADAAAAQGSTDGDPDPGSAGTTTDTE